VNNAINKSYGDFEQQRANVDDKLWYL